MKNLIASALILVPASAMAQATEPPALTAEDITRDLNTSLGRSPARPPIPVAVPAKAAVQASAEPERERLASVAPQLPTAPLQEVSDARPETAITHDLNTRLPGRPAGQSSVTDVVSEVDQAGGGRAPTTAQTPPESRPRSADQPQAQPRAAAAPSVQAPPRSAAVTPSSASPPAARPVTNQAAPVVPLRPATTAPAQTNAAQNPASSAPATQAPVTQVPVSRGPASGSNRPAAPVPGVLASAAVAALPFRVDLPTGVQVTSVSSAQNAKVWSIRKGATTLLMIFAGTQSQFPIYDGEQVTVAGRTSVVVTEGQKRIAMEHLFQRASEPMEIHVWLMASSEADRNLAEQIAQTVDPK